MGSDDATGYLTGTVELPGTLKRAIGDVIVRWAYLENHLQRTCYLLLGVTFEQGRLAVQEPRASDRPKRLAELAALRGIKVDDKRIGALQKGMKEIGELRDSIAHGVWFFSPDHLEYALSFTRGSWDDRNDLKSVHRKKKVSPEGLLLNAVALKHISAQIEALTDHSRAVHAEVLAQVSAEHA